MRWVSTRVLPDPAPATISSGVPACTTASTLARVQPLEQCRAAGGAGCRRKISRFRGGGSSNSALIV